VDSRPGEGSTFSVHLPRASEDDVAAEREGAAAGLLPGSAPPIGATILVAEDEPDVRAVIGRLLRLAGYDVLTAADGKQALARAREYKGPIDLLITDVVMGELGGVDLARELGAERPRLRVLFITG